MPKQRAAGFVGAGSESEAACRPVLVARIVCALPESFEFTLLRAVWAVPSLKLLPHELTLFNSDDAPNPNQDSPLLCAWAVQVSSVVPVHGSC